MRAAFMMLSLAGLLLSACDRVDEDIALQRIERSGFTLDFPLWPTRHDEDGRSVGRFGVLLGRRLVEAHWSASAASSVEELQQVATSVQQGFGFRLHQQSSETLPGQIRLHVTFHVEGKAWAAMSLVQCTEPGVLVTLAVTDERRGAAVALRDRVLDTLVCPDSAAQIAGVWPSTDLPDDFGVLVAESIVLGDRDGRWLMIAGTTTGLVREMDKSHEAASRVLASYGGMIGAKFTLQGSAARARTASGAASVWYMDAGTLGAIVATTFVCLEEHVGYIVLAGHDNGASSHADLEALSLRFACPNARIRPSFRGVLRPLLDRPGVCEVGAEALCESITATD
jgi:hypothetical protein